MYMVQIVCIWCDKEKRELNLNPISDYLQETFGHKVHI